MGTVVPVATGIEQAPDVVDHGVPLPSWPVFPPSQFHSMNFTIDECSIVMGDGAARAKGPIASSGMRGP